MFKIRKEESSSETTSWDIYDDKNYIVSSDIFGLFQKYYMSDSFLFIDIKNHN